MPRLPRDGTDRHRVPTRNTAIFASSREARELPFGTRTNPKPWLTMRTILLSLSFALLAVGCGGTVDASSDQTPFSDGGLTIPPDAAVSLDSSDSAPTADATKPEASGPPTVPPEGQKILFEMSYVNYAWDPTVSGFYVTADGSVFKYDFYGSSPDAGEPFVSLVPGMTEEQVTGKHGPAPTLVTKIDTTTLLQRFALVGAARTGTLLTQYLCADAGEARFVAYLFDPASLTYTPVMLGSSGDRATKNTAPEGGELMKWLSSLGGGGSDFCEYRLMSCEKELCDGTPACKTGEVPIGLPEEACFDDCASPPSCEHVADCSVCAAGGSDCVVDQLGLAHCMYPVYGCDDHLTCECAGDQICAGGKPFCQGDAESGLRCVAP